MEQTPPTQDSQSQSPQPPVMSLAGRMTNVIAAPGEAFEAVKNSPPCPANWVVPALLLVLLSWIGTAVLFSQPTVNQQIVQSNQEAMQQQREKQHLSPDKAEQMRQMQEKWTPIIAAIGIGLVWLFIGFVGPFIWGLFLWLIGAKAFHGGFTYMKAVEVVGLANVIVTLGSVVWTLMVLSLNNLYASPSLGLLVINGYDPQSTVHGLLSQVNVMTFWVLAVRAVGLARLGNVSFAKAAACVFGIWFAYTAFFTGLGAGAKALFSAAKGT